jgi:methyl-accepting chemotaxis protein
VIQNNSATAQEGAAASPELAGQADLLKEKIGYFRLQDQNTKDPEINENLMQ